MLIDTPDFTTASASELYRLIFKKKADALALKISDGDLLTTLHEGENEAFLTVINHFDGEKKFELSLDGYELCEEIYGSAKSVKAFDACVLKFKKK